MLLSFYTFASGVTMAEKALRAEFIAGYNPSLKLCPGDLVPVITHENTVQIDQMRWGMSPLYQNSGVIQWVKNEGIIKNRISKVLIRTRRCLVPANCFYLEFGEKTYLIHFPLIRIFTFAGIWAEIISENGSKNRSLAIITIPSQGKLKKLTNRIPAVIYGNSAHKYLNIRSSLMEITSILNGMIYPEISGFPIKKRIVESDSIETDDLRPDGPDLFPKEKFPEKAILRSSYYLI